MEAFLRYNVESQGRKGETKHADGIGRNTLVLFRRILRKTLPAGKNRTDDVFLADGFYCDGNLFGGGVPIRTIVRLSVSVGSLGSIVGNHSGRQFCSCLFFNSAFVAYQQKNQKIFTGNSRFRHQEQCGLNGSTKSKMKEIHWRIYFWNCPLFLWDTIWNVTGRGK